MPTSPAVFSDSLHEVLSEREYRPADRASGKARLVVPEDKPGFEVIAV